MTMAERFKEYLVKEFRTIAPSEDAMNYRKEVFGNLMDKAQELRIKGMDDEDAIFNACIDSLGDFRDTLKAFDSKRVMIVKAAAKGKVAAMSVALAVILLVVAYLAVSFAVPGIWGKTWLILVGGIFAGIVSVFGVVIAKSVKKEKFPIVHLLTTASIVLMFVLAFLVVQILFNAQYTWFTFLVMVIAVLVTEAMLGFILPTNKIIRTIVVLFAVEVTCALVYVMLGVAGVLAWHPYWLLPVGGVAIDIGILVALATGAKKKKEKDVDVKKYDEDFYTNWD